MNALAHATYRVLPNRGSNQYTPGLQRCPSTIFSDAHDSEPMAGAHTSLCELSFPLGLSALDSVTETVLLVPVGACLLAFPLTTTTSISHNLMIRKPFPGHLDFMVTRGGQFRNNCCVG